MSDKLTGWAKRMPGTRGVPAGVGNDSLVQYVLLGDPKVYNDRAGNLAWGDGPGSIESYRVLGPALPTVPTGTIPRSMPGPVPAPKKHAHYFKSVRGMPEIDVYRVLELFSVADPAIGHAVKKLLVAGGRGAGKDVTRDIQEAIDTLQRWQEMRVEDSTLPRA